MKSKIDIRVVALAFGMLCAGLVIGWFGTTMAWHAKIRHAIAASTPSAEMPPKPHGWIYSSSKDQMNDAVTYFAKIDGETPRGKKGYLLLASDPGTKMVDIVLATDDGRFDCEPNDFCLIEYRSAKSPLSVFEAHNTENGRDNAVAVNKRDLKRFLSILESPNGGKFLVRSSLSDSSEAFEFSGDPLNASDANLNWVASALK